MAALVLVAFAVFSYLYSRGISPVWAAVAIVCFRGFFRFLYKIACLLVAAAGGRMAEPVFTDRVALTWQMRAGAEPPLLEQLRELTRGQGRVEVSAPFYGAV